MVASEKADTTSPVGTWIVTSLNKSDGCFGSRWIGLNVPWGNYAIHGTNSPISAGCKASHGCIRMLNSDNNISLSPWTAFFTPSSASCSCGLSILY
jgi:lipoprotein-anchoring transpeptidase ErfK/SrfK